MRVKVGSAIRDGVRERGQVLVLVAICLTVLFGFAALAVDVGYLRYEQRLQQTAADSAAIAGAGELYYNPSQQAVTTAAQEASATNGFTNHNTKTFVIVNIGSNISTGPYQGNPGAVEVFVTVIHPAFFSSIWGATNTVTARAVALLGSNGPGAPGACIWALQKDVTMNHGTLNATSCGVMAARNIHAAGATINTGFLAAGGSVDGTGPNTAGVSIENDILAFPDPCLKIPGCAALGSSPLTSPAGPCVNPTGTSLTPGYYCNMNVSGTVNFAPGLYVIQNGMTTGADLIGSGVTLYVQSGKVQMNGVNTNLSGPPPVEGSGTATVTTAGGAPGVVFYQPGCQGASPENFSAQSMLGLIYAPNCHINLNGGGSTVTISFVVAQDIVANGAVTTVSQGTGGPLVQNPNLVE